MIDATLRLLLVRPVAGVSVRDIAAEAGVNHGLVHRHFGSKDGLIRAAVKRAASVVYTDETPPRTRWFYDRLREHPELAILVARACLDGPSELLAIAAPPPALLEQLADRITPALRRLGMRPGDAHVVNALVTSALLGWFVFRPMLEAGYKLPARADDSLAQTIALLDHLLDANSASPR
ncbi:MAG TPA: helix-turn-helix domain-containing protein [Kofleriaceae bacterium]|nr:helix-turn-helix domain-containing protein [Kofleriaceae bacterium]